MTAWGTRTPTSELTPILSSALGGSGGSGGSGGNGTGVGGMRLYQAVGGITREINI